LYDPPVWQTGRRADGR